jgi:sigma-B regulation protein RsbU (phosphoserine phosphatase)
MVMRYINSGHNSPFIIRGKEIIFLDEGTLVLGMFPEVIYEYKEQKLRKNDIIVLYTDGVIEAENKSGEQYSLERLIEIIKRNKENDANIMKDTVIKELKNFTGIEHFTDDVTFMIIKLR